MPAQTPGYLGSGSTKLGGFVEVIAGLAAFVVIAGYFSSVKLVQAIFHGVPIIGRWIDTNLENTAVAAYHSLGNVFATPAEPYVRSIVVHKDALHPLITGTHAAIVTHDLQLTNLHGIVNTLTYGHPVPETQKHAAETIASVNARIEKQNKEIAAANRQIAAINYRLSHGYLHTIEQKIAAAQSKAEQNASAAATVALHAQDEIYRRKVSQIGSAVGLPTGILESTIPIALALSVGYEGTIAEEVAQCLEPMCNDWNAAKNALEGALGALTVGGAISFLVAALTEPAVAGKLVAGEADAIGDLAIDSFYGILGLQPPGTTGLGL